MGACQRFATLGIGEIALLKGNRDVVVVNSADNSGGTCTSWRYCPIACKPRLAGLFRYNLLNQQGSLIPASSA